MARTGCWSHTERVLLTYEQVRAYELPATEGKHSDPRWPAFARRNGQSLTAHAPTAGATWSRSTTPASRRTQPDTGEGHRPRGSSGVRPTRPPPLMRSRTSARPLSTSHDSSCRRPREALTGPGSRCRREREAPAGTRQRRDDGRRLRSQPALLPRTPDERHTASRRLAPSCCPKPSTFDAGSTSRTARETLLLVIDRAIQGIGQEEEGGLFDVVVLGGRGPPTTVRHRRPRPMPRDAARSRRARGRPSAPDHRSVVRSPPAPRAAEASCRSSPSSTPPPGSDQSFVSATVMPMTVRVRLGHSPSPDSGTISPGRNTSSLFWLVQPVYDADRKDTTATEPTGSGAGGVVPRHPRECGGRRSGNGERVPIDACRRRHVHGHDRVGDALSKAHHLLTKGRVHSEQASCP